MASDLVHFSVPMLPPSGNHHTGRTKTGRHYTTGAAKNFWETVKIFCRGKNIRCDAYAVRIDVHLGSGERGDLDNFAKCAIDGLVKAGVIHSDAAVTSLAMRKYRAKDSRIDYWVTADAA